MIEQTRKDNPRLAVKLEAVAVSSGDAFLICPCGRVDGSTVGILEEAVQKRIEAGAAVLIFDLEKTNYISSAGFAGIIVERPQDAVE